MADFAWAIIGPGAIAQRFAEAVHQLPGTYLHAVLGRHQERAASFAAQWANSGMTPLVAPIVASDLDALLADTRIDGIYIATPHANHGEMVQRCLAAGKPVLCEKPLVPNLAQAQALVTLSRQHQVFLMEALWTRFLPIYGIVAEWLQSQAIGKVHGIQSSFCFTSDYDPQSRLYHPALAGGSLLDIGIYNVAITRWVLEMALGRCPDADALRADGVLAPTGVDQRVSGSIFFPEGVTSQFICALDTSADNALRIFGERGTICLPHNFWEATEAILQRNGEVPQTVQAPHRINGFEGEIEETMRCIHAGLIESPHMPHSETLAIISWLDEFRRQLGVRYPFEA
jgi:predicted dehydrogenase